MTFVGTARPSEPAPAVEADDAIPVEYRAEDLIAAVRDTVGGRDVDVVLETHTEAHLLDDLELVGRG